METDEDSSVLKKKKKKKKKKSPRTLKLYRDLLLIVTKPVIFVSLNPEGQEDLHP